MICLQHYYYRARYVHSCLFDFRELDFQQILLLVIWVPGHFTFVCLSRYTLIYLTSPSEGANSFLLRSLGEISVMRWMFVYVLLKKCYEYSKKISWMNEKMYLAHFAEAYNVWRCWQVGDIGKFPNWPATSHFGRFRALAVTHAHTR